MEAPLRVIKLLVLLASAVLSSCVSTLPSGVWLSDAEKNNLTFDTDAKELEWFGSISNTIFKPKGEGPFPAIVLLHNCGGITGNERALRYWIEEGIKEGYAVLVVDSMRGAKNNCYPPLPVNIWRRTKDAFDALSHIKRLSYIDPRRTAVMGFSQGAMVGTLVSSREVADAFSPRQRFAAVVSLYPMCYISWPLGIYSLEYLRPDTDTPLLVLMGGMDNETPTADCLPRLQALKDMGAPVEWHLYSEATHCWDCVDLDGFSKVDWKGDRINYKFSQETRDDSRRRAFDFLRNCLNNID